MLIRPFAPNDEPALVALWRRCDLTRPWNDPHLDIQRKRTVQPELLVVGEIDEAIVAAGMAGFDGHRGWVNYVAVDSRYQGRGLGRQLMAWFEESLTNLGCPKVNIQVREANDTVLSFYRKLGYDIDPVVSMGKRLIPDDQAR